MNLDVMQSIFHVRVSELYPKRPLVSEDPSLVTPFCPVQGESVEYLGQTTDGVLALSNYRLFLQLKDTYFNIPLGLVESIECRDIFFLHVHCKDARSIRCTFATNEHCMEWHRRLQKATAPAKTVDDIFAFAFYAWSMEDGGDELLKLGIDITSPQTESWDSRFHSELARMDFDLRGAWRISTSNRAFQLCSSYPPAIVVPACISDEKLQKVSSFRSAQRVPAVVWRHRGNGAVISRCSQPEVGWLGWRSAEDEELVKAIADACATDRGRNNQQPDYTAAPPASAVQNGNTPSLEEFTEEIQKQGDSKKVLILDARSYATAVANRARGGGCECPEYYPNCEIQFMNLANIHSIRKSFHNVRLLCSSSTDQANWYSQLESTKWIHHMAGLLKAAVTVATAVEEEGRPVLVHCSDGWDRTPQIVALAELLLDPFYRTIEGFQVLVEKEWLDFGHKFGDRCGQGLSAEDLNERCPVFLQWLDCVHQFLHQFKCSFEFNQAYLVKLAHHTYSNLFGTFLFNSGQERINMHVQERTHSAWRFLRSGSNQDKFRNNLYVSKDAVLWPSCNIGDLKLWTQVYIGEVASGSSGSPQHHLVEDHPHPHHHNVSTSSVASLSNDAEDDGVAQACAPACMTKTRSCDNLTALIEHTEELQRRSSDPNILDSILEAHLRTPPSVHQAASLLESTEENESECDEKEIMLQGTDESCEEASIMLESKGEEEDDNLDIPCKHLPNGESPQMAPPEHTRPLDVQSIESSTDTLVAEAGTIHDCHPTPLSAITNCAENEVELAVAATEEDPGLPRQTRVAPDSPSPCEAPPTTTIVARCQVCASSRRLLETSEVLLSREGSPSSTTASSRASAYSTPLHSRTPSSGFPATPSEEQRAQSVAGVVAVGNSVVQVGIGHCMNGGNGATFSPSAWKFDVDGMSLLKDDVQTRVQQIVMDYKAQIDALQRELYMTRLALIQQVGHQCGQSGEQPDDNGSLPDSVCSGEHHSVGQESVHSDVSWEAVEERDTRPPLWVPDFAVTHCMGCHHQFWLGRRRHHCRYN